jgi:hypothetical protein
MPPSSAIRHSLSAALVPLTLSVLAAVGITWACGGTLGVYIGALLAVTLLIPPTVSANQQVLGRRWVVWLVVAPLAAAWLSTARRTDTTMSEWGASSAVVLAYAIGLAGIVSALPLLRLSAIVSAALTVVLGLAWLTWPIWLSPTWNGEASAGWVNRLVVVHPALSVSLPHLGHWDEQSLAYHLTDLNQSVPYAPPHSVWVCVLVHVLVGAALFELSALLGRRNTAAPDPPG